MSFVHKPSVYQSVAARKNRIWRSERKESACGNLYSRPLQTRWIGTYKVLVSDGHRQPFFHLGNDEFEDSPLVLMKVVRA